MLTYLLRLDTQGRVAVQRDLVPTQPDGDNDGYACGDQFEHERRWAWITGNADGAADTNGTTNADALTPNRSNGLPDVC